MANCRKCKKILTVGEVIQYDGLCMNCKSSIMDFVDNQPPNVCDSTRSVYPLLADVRAVLMQEVNVYEVTPGNWAFANAGIISDGFSEKYFAEIEALRAIINGGIKISEHFS